MSRFTRSCVFLFLIGGWSEVSSQDTYDFGFMGPEQIVGQPGSVQTEEFFCSITHAGSAGGIQGYSFGATFNGGEVLDLTMQGTDALLYLNPDPSMHFIFTEFTHGEGNEGFVCAVVLDFSGQNMIPANSTFTLAKITVNAVIPEEGGTAELKYVEGLQGTGDPVFTDVISDVAGQIVKTSSPVALSLPSSQDTDQDHDGIPDEEDACASSNLEWTVTIGGHDSGVHNQVLQNGCTMSDRISNLYSSSKNHGHFVSRVARMATDLRKEGTITSDEGALLVVCAAQTN